MLVVGTIGLVARDLDRLQVRTLDSFFAGVVRTCALELELRFDLDDRSRIQIRPSGTEPKLKIYGEVVVTVGDDEPVSAGRARGRAHCSMLLEAAAAALG